jgi:hypothetical protein
MAAKSQEDDPYDAADNDYQNKFNKTGKSLKERESAPDNQTNDKKDLKSQESKGTINWKRDGKKKDHKTSLVKQVAGNLRNKSAFVFVVVMILVGIGYSSIFAPNIILVNIKDLFTNDLADSTTALAKYTVKMIDYKLGKSDCGDKDTIKCKLTTMSRNQKQTLERHGFKVNGEKVDEDNLDDNDPKNDKTKESRWKVSSIDFPKNAGSASDGKSYQKLADTSDEIRYLTNGVWNPRSSFYQDARFRQRIKNQYDLTKSATTYGTTEEQVNKSFDASMQGSNEKIDESGRGAFSLKTLGGGKGSEGLNKTAMAIANLSNSYVGNQCAYYTAAKVVYNDAKKAKQVTVARFAMQYLKAADQIKSGLSDEITANTLSGKLAWSSDGGYAGKNATDASMYRHIVMREGVKDSSNGMKYYLDAFDSIGAMFPPWLATIFITQQAVKGIAHLPGGLALPPADIGKSARDYCLEGQKDSNKAANKAPTDCPALTTAGTPAPMIPAVAGFAAASNFICPPPPRGIWMMYPTSHPTVLTVMPFVSNLFIGAIAGWANKTADDFTSNTKGIAASDAVFAGTGEILGDMAMSRGMQPATIASLTKYLSHKDDAQKQAESLARYKARQSPFDIYNKYSFLGALAKTVGAAPTAQATVFSSLTNILALLPSTVKGLTSDANAIYNLQPDQLDPSRLKCPDAEYLAIGINADMACNVRYSMGDKEMDADINNVLDYMLKSHSDLTQKNVDELQKRLQDTDHGADMQDQQDVQRQLQEAKDASGKPEIDKKTGKPIQHSEFEKFMDYCVNRQDPWGRSAMVVHREGLSDEDKEKRHQDNDANGNKVGSNGGDEYELHQTASYMSVYEGASADQDWYTGKKCLEDSEELQNFRSYTMACSVDGSFAGAPDCTEADHQNFYTDDFYTSNDIQYLSWW